MKKELTNFLNNSKWLDKFGNHFEQEVGLVNFSVIGRNCTQKKQKNTIFGILKIRKEDHM